MAGPSGFLDIDIVGDQRGVQGMLDHLDSALSPTGLALFLNGAVQPWLLERAQARFAGEGDDVVGKWAPLQESTVEIRESHGFEGHHPINRRTGQLEEYMTQSNADVVSVPGAAVLTFPSKGGPMNKALQQKMETAQRGRANPSTKPRPVLGLNEKDLAFVMTSLAFHIRGFGGGVGR